MRSEAAVSLRQTIQKFIYLMVKHRLVHRILSDWVKRITGSHRARSDRKLSIEWRPSRRERQTAKSEKMLAERSTPVTAVRDGVVEINFNPW
jgi:hypothetical protein